MLRERFRFAALAAVLLLSSVAAAQEAVCAAPVSKVPLERHLRQLTLDLLGRPPTIEEYRAAQAKGRIGAEDIRALMGTEAFYARMRGYHRSLLRSNISASVFNNGNARFSGTGAMGDPLGLRGNPASALRGANNMGCDAFIEQSQCNAAGTPQQDPHLEPPLASKQCHDTQGVPLPVSVDYDANFFQCTQLDTNAAPIASCADALAAPGRDPALLYFCDMRRVPGDGNKPHPHLCLPHPERSSSAPLTERVLDGEGKVVAFVYPNPPAGAPLTRLDRCSLTLGLRNGLTGAYVPQRGCIQREGYVLAPAPYWATNTNPVAVCAIEAQARATNPWTLESCETARFSGDRSCGCGERMRRCEERDNRTHTARVEAFNAEPEWIADSVLKRDEPYFNLLTTRRSFVNGTLSEFYRHNQGVGVFTVSPPVDLDALPAVPFTEPATWREYTRGPQHSGVLTTPSFLYRFPTYRARVNHFYEAFLCKTFTPAPGGSLPPPEDACNRENNLAKRCGCNYCHATIEPTGAHWGRYGERAALFLSPEQFPRFDPKCRDCALSGDTTCGGECTQYVMQAYDGDGAHSLGMLKTYLYRTPDEELNIEGGPQVLVQRMLQTGDLERCTVRRIWQEFLGRPMSAEEQRLYLQPLADDFTRDGHRLKALIERVLMTDAYRRID